VALSSSTLLQRVERIGSAPVQRQPALLGLVVEGFLLDRTTSALMLRRSF
jgi:hypothetical protein